MLALKHLFNKCWLVLLQLACETPINTILIGKTYIPFSDRSYSELGILGVIGNHLSLFLPPLFSSYVVWFIASLTSPVDAIIQQQDTQTLFSGVRVLHMARGCSFSYTAHQMWLWTQHSYTHERAWSQRCPDGGSESGENALLSGQDEVKGN